MMKMQNCSVLIENDFFFLFNVTTLVNGISIPCTLQQITTCTLSV